MAQGANHPVPTISTHVLDTERGVPAVGVHVTLYRLADDGRVRDLLERPLTAGDYRLEFVLALDPASVTDEARFFRRMTLDLLVTDVARSYHVPLLMAPFSMTTYRGS